MISFSDPFVRRTTALAAGVPAQSEYLECLPGLAPDNLPRFMALESLPTAALIVQGLHNELWADDGYASFNDILLGIYTKQDGTIVYRRCNLVVS